jgi:hypothetical protein
VLCAPQVVSMAVQQQRHKRVRVSVVDTPPPLAATHTPHLTGCRWHLARSWVTAATCGPLSTCWWSRWSAPTLCC